MKNKILFGLIFLFAATVLVYIKLDNVFDSLFVNFLFLFFPLVAALGCAYTLRKLHVNTVRGKVFLFLTLGMFSWFLAELLWTMLVVFLDIEPFPSFVDIFYLLAYPLLAVGFVLEYRMGKIKWDLYRVLLVSSISFILIALTGYFGVFYAYDVDNSIWENIFNISYGVGDIILSILALFILMIVMEYKRGKFFRPWLYVFFGVILMIVADILYSIYFDQYESGVKIYQYIDFLWMGSYLLFAYGFFGIGYVINRMQIDLKKKLVKLSK